MLVSMNKKSLTPVILDTNALLMQFEFKINLKDELTKLLGVYEIQIPSSVLNELENLKDKYSSSAFKFALKYKIIMTEKKGDESILTIAKELNAVVVTNDRILRKRLKLNGIRVIYLRQKSYLALDIP
jgi:rRNA-processing protein FCF1